VLSGEHYCDILLPVTFRRQKFPTVIPFVIDSVKPGIMDVLVLIILNKLFFVTNVFLKVNDIIGMIEHARGSVNSVGDENRIHKYGHTATKKRFEFLSIVVKVQTDFMTVLVI
jgi:hypothetical protein